MIATHRPAVLNVGLHPSLVTEMAGTRESFTAVDADAVWAGLAAMEREADGLGLTFSSFLVQDLGDDVPSKFRDVLAQRHHDFIVIGGGVRLEPSLTPLFEILVNSVIAVSPQSTLCFNTGPTTTIDAVRRWWPTPPTDDA